MAVRGRLLCRRSPHCLVMVLGACLYGIFLIVWPDFIYRATEDQLAVQVSGQMEAYSIGVVSRLTVHAAGVLNRTSQPPTRAAALPEKKRPTAVSRQNATKLQGKVDEETEEEKFMHRMAEVQLARHALLRQRCRDNYNITDHLDFRRDRKTILSWKPLYEHAYANDDFRFIICRVLKVGSFSWRKVIRSLHTKGTPDFRRKQPIGDFPMTKYDDETFLAELESFKKILFVREPMARLLSGYRDKYVELRHFPYYRTVGSGIIRRFRKGATKSEIASGRPTFEEFVRWVVREPDDRRGDFHWRPLFDWYHPCQMQYDFIGKLETSAEDARYIFRDLGIDKLEHYPSTETHHKFSSTRDILRRFYSQISPELLPKIVHRYRGEFVLFNYTMPRTLSDVWTT